MSEPLLRMEHITKRFPGVLALDDVSLEILPGETHGLLGENGAGKSTLLKILSGAYQPDAGSIMLGGKPLELKNPLDAQKHGIVTIYQEFNLIPTMTVAENMFLGREPGKGVFVSWSRMRDETEKVLRHLNLDLDPMMPVSDLSVGEQQMVEIARALSRDSRIIVMDEPTAALTEREVEGLFRIVADLKARGLSIIYVTHRLHEVEQICDRVTVLRDGKRVGGGNVGELKIDDFVKMMVGRSSSQLFTRLGGHRTTGPIVMTARGICRDRDPTNPHATLLKDVSIDVRAGEILGLAGLMGAGRTELARAIFGADPFERGSIEIDGKPLILRSPMDAIRNGIGLVPEDRKKQALFLDLAVRHNLAISSLKDLAWGRWFVSERSEAALVERFRKALDIRMASADIQIADLSGGNQQKVVLARWLALKPKVLIVDEPTRGIDIAAKAEVHQQLDAMARAGIAIVAISSELPEVMAISDRIVIMREGRVTGTMPGDRATEESLMHLMAIEQTGAQGYAGGRNRWRRTHMSEAVTEKPRAQTRSVRSRIIPLLSRYAPVVCLVLLIVIFAVLTDGRFLKPLNLFNVMRQISIEGLIAVGMTFVILTAGIDLSVGSLVAVAGLSAALIAKGSAATSFSLSESEATGYGWYFAMLGAIAVGYVGGAIQGTAITKLKVPPFVVTLGGLSVFRGMALMISGSGPISGFDEAYRWWGQGRIGPVPVPVIIFLAIAAVAFVVLRYTRYGRQVYAVGGNREAARLAGVNVERVLLSVYVIIGFLAGLAGFVLSARLNSSEAVAGMGYELNVIAAVVIGGTSLFGGVGTIFGTVIGSILIGVLINGLVLMNVNPYVQQITIGLILVAVVAFDQFAKSRRLK